MVEAQLPYKDVHTCITFTEHMRLNGPFAACTHFYFIFIRLATANHF